MNTFACVKMSVQFNSRNWLFFQKDCFSRLIFVQMADNSDYYTHFGKLFRAAKDNKNRNKQEMQRQLNLAWNTVNAVKNIPKNATT